MPTAFFYRRDIKSMDIAYEENESPNRTECAIDSHSDQIVFYMDITSRVILPSIFMIIFSILLIHTVFRSRLRFVRNYTKKENLTFKRDIRLAISSILINVIYVLLSLPVSVVYLFNDYLTEYYFNLLSFITFYLFIISYSINFYIVILTNSLFRNECSILFKRKRLVFLLCFFVCLILSLFNSLKVNVSF